MTRPTRQPPKPSPSRQPARHSTTSKKGATKSSRPQPGRAAARSSRAAAPPPPQPSWWSSLSAERKIDILGILMALIGFLALLSLISSSHGTLTGWLAGLMRQAAGVGALIVPAALLVLGLWLILRKIDRFPAPSGERLAGFILLFLNILAVIHVMGGGGWELAGQGQGGGYLGALGERLLVSSLGQAGAIVALVAWFLLALVLTLDISIQDIARFVARLSADLAGRWRTERELVEARRLAGAAPPTPAVETPARMVMPPQGDLPPDFIPLRGPTASNGTPASSTGQKPAPRKSTAAPGADKAGAAHSEAAQTVAQPAAAAPVWALPKLEEILEPPTQEAVKGTVDVERGRIIEETLASFGTPAHIVEIHRGPTVTQYGVEPDFVETRGSRMRVRVSKIVSLADDLALALAAPRIRIQAPVPGRNYVGIEVPNTEVSRVLLREIMESEPFQKMRGALRFAVGKDVSGKAVSYDLANMPHLLIAGTTGSGKSVCVNALLSCLLLNNTPAELRMILVDPKRVELTGYNGIPHMLGQVIVEAEQVVGALQWVQREMDARYHRFSQVGARNILEYNRKNSPALPYLLVLVDELADLMMLAPDETERSLTRLAQLARATGIHLVLATQRPSVDVVTGLIKANFPARIAFAVASGVDSRVILDQPGAERLLGRGDMLFQAPDAAAPVRLQGVFVSDPEIQRLVDYWRTQDYTQRIQRQIPNPDGTAEPVRMEVPAGVPLKQAPLWDEEMGGKGGDPVLEDAIALVRQEGKASISMLQRKMRIGYTRAARLIDAMEEKGIIGPAQPTSQVRPVLDMGDEEGD